MSKNQLTSTLPSPPKTAQNPFSKRPHLPAEHPRSRSNSDFYHTISNGRSDDVESSLLDGNLFSKQPIFPGLPKLENLFKNQKMEKLLVNDVLHTMVHSRKKKEQHEYLEKLRTSTKHGTKRHSVAATKFSSSGGVSRIETMRKVDVQSQET